MLVTDTQTEIAKLFHDQSARQSDHLRISWLFSLQQPIFSQLSYGESLDVHLDLLVLTNQLIFSVGQKKTVRNKALSAKC